MWSADCPATLGRQPWDGDGELVSGAVNLADFQPPQAGAGVAIGLFDHVAAIAAARQHIAGGEGGIQAQRQAAVEIAMQAGISLATPLAL